MITDSRSIPTGELLRLVADEDRRQVVEYLAETEDGSATVADLAVVLETDSPAPGARPEEMAIVLNHRHLPKLDEAGVVDYDPDRELVRYLASERIERLLAFVADEQA
jgi:DNA-binding transcriptional ArsR family regulator